MEAYGELLSNVAKTVDKFMTDNISDDQACDWMVIGYPQVICLDLFGVRNSVIAGNSRQPPSPRLWQAKRGQRPENGHIHR